MSNVDDPRRVDGDTGTTLMRILLSGKIQLTFVFAAFIAALAVPESAIAKVHAVSTDGEATVYLARDFTRDFDVSYSVQFFRTPQNRSWAFVSLLLLGRTAESGSLGVGLSRGPGHEAALTGFTDATKPQVAPIYRTSRNSQHGLRADR